MLSLEGSLTLVTADCPKGIICSFGKNASTEGRRKKQKTNKKTTNQKPPIIIKYI